MREIFQLFSNTRFRTLWFARIISNVGNGMAPIALSFGVLELPGATARELGYVLTAQAITIVVMLPLGGVIADRYPRAALVAITDLLGSLFVMANGLLFITGTATVWVIALNNALFGVLAAVWWPAFSGIIPAIIDQTHWSRANAVIGIANNGGMIFGAAIGGALVTFAGPGWAIFIDGVSFVIAGVLVWQLRHTTPRAESTGESVTSDLRNGFRTFMSFRWVWVVVAAFSIIVACMRAGFDVAGPVLFKQAYNGAADYAKVQTLYAVGFLLGAVIAAKYKPQRPLVFCLLTTLAMPLQTTLLALQMPVWVLAIGAMLVGISFEQWGVNWSTALQTHIPRDSLSRVSAFDAMGSLILGPVGLAAAGPLIAGFGVSAVLFGCGLITLLMVGLQFLEPEVRGLRWIDPDNLPEEATPEGA